MPEIGHNSGVSPEIAAAAMTAALAPWEERRAELERKAEGAMVDDVDSAEAAIDFVRMARALADKARDLLAEVEGPYKEAAQAARAVALRFTDTLETAAGTVNDRLAAYNTRRRQRAEEAQREQERAEQQLREASGLETAPPPPESSTPPQKRRKSAPIRTMLGGRMSEQQKWRPKVVDVKLVPETILNTPKVREAIESVARAMLQNGIDVPGVEKDYYDTHSIS